MKLKNASMTIEYASNGYIIRKNWDSPAGSRDIGGQPTLSNYSESTEVAVNFASLLDVVKEFSSQVNGEL